MEVVFMPKDTFFNLSYEKKKKIIDAAVQEFSTRRFSEASLNQIVKTAKIPWGSFYQYFEDKEDIFGFVYGEILKEKREIISHSVTITPEMDVFEACLKTIKATFEWSRLKPEYSRIGMLMELDNSELPGCVWIRRKVSKVWSSVTKAEALSDRKLIPVW